MLSDLCSDMRWPCCSWVSPNLSLRVRPFSKDPVFVWGGSVDHGALADLWGCRHTHRHTHLCIHIYICAHTYISMFSLSLFLSLNQKSPHCIDFSDFCFPSTWQTHHYPSTQRWSQCLTLCFMVEFIETQTQAIVQSSQALYPWVMPTTLNVCLNNSITEQTLMLRIDPPEEKLEIRLSMKILPPIPPLLFLEMWNICNNERCLLYRLPPICFLLCCS